MKINSCLLIIVLFAGAAGLSFKEKPQDSLYTIKKSTVKLSGSTNIEHWEMTSNSIESAAAFSLKNGQLSIINSLDFTLNVKTLVSRNKSRDKNIYKFLKTYPYDKIYFRYKYSQIKPLANGRFIITVTGNLTIAGITQIQTLDLNCDVYPNGLMQVYGSSVLNMSKFKVKPERLPKAVRVNDEVMVTIKFDFENGEIT